ncbi:DUF1972 domain-containing protein [Persicobacter sp. CCB-QB2]|uniref:DUF1972 domain-containing protein n=1 Tax=Persicobacter sp. CCB-QB2 TaxID=1561025 RepID=UPI00092EEB05|nr:DUF1972 domain-containing protein [Persicobacter sp. CCB-QB2]
MKEKIAVIGTVGVPACYGGFETLVHQLVLHLNQQFDFTVYCSAHHYPKGERPRNWNNAKLVYLPLKANGVQSILYDILSIIHALFFADVLLILGVSGCIILPFVKLFRNKKVIVHIDGLEWKRAKWHPLAKAYLKFAEMVAVRFSDADIADNEAIRKYTALRYRTLSACIAYGGDQAEKVIANAQDFQNFPFLQKPYAFGVCRIEPENNIHLILEAFSTQENMPLVLVGNWDNSPYGQKLKQIYRGHSHLHLLDPIYENRPLNLIRSRCFCYIHGHSAGGTNPSLVEAMNLNLPIIAFDVIYNRCTTNEQAFYFKDHQSLNDLLQRLTKEEYQQCSHRMYDLAQTHYQWAQISQQYTSLINGIMEDYQKPEIFTYPIPQHLIQPWETSQTIPEPAQKLA